MNYTIAVSGGSTLSAAPGDNLLDLLRQHGLAPDAPCGGNGKCGKCRVLVDGKPHLACQYQIQSNCSVVIPAAGKAKILTGGTMETTVGNPVGDGYLAAYDIGTTTVVCFVLDPQGRELAVASMTNPQTSYGADVISRIQYALKGEQHALTASIRRGMTALLEECCAKAEITPAQLGVVSVVGNPCMQQLFLGISPENLAKIPFAPVLTQAQTLPAEPYLPGCARAKLLVVPDISGYVGADTLGCVLATQLHRSSDTVLLVDIGTNGEMVLTHGGRMVACSTAAGPALEGANIRFGMRAEVGAIDHVWLEENEIRYSVIGGAAPRGICGSGLIDAVAVMLELGALNSRGRIQSQAEVDGQRIFYLSEEVYLTQEDIRQVQLAKGAIAAGIHLMAEHLGLTVGEIDRVILAGAFGSYLKPGNACRMGLLPRELAGKITAAGNIAGSGAKLLALDTQQLEQAQELTETIEFLELASVAGFQRMFARHMGF